MADKSNLETINRVLERVWGMDYLPMRDCSARIPRPGGFIIVEPPPVKGGGQWSLYLVRKKNLTTYEAARLLARETRAVRYSFMGLKDRHALAYQYIGVYKPRIKPRHIIVGDYLEAWLIRGNSSGLVLGEHGRNIFHIVLETRGDCSIGDSVFFFPNYYGPQRFGVCKPDSHLQGLFNLLGRASLGVALELQPLVYFRMREGNSFSKRFFGSVNNRIIREALQAYVFNRGLARIIEEGEDASSIGERMVRLPCPFSMGSVRVPAVRLPGRGFNWGSSWGRIVSRILREESIPPEVFSVLGSPFRPLIVRPCWSIVSRKGDGVWEVLFSLPRGSYASVYLRFLSRIEWLEECNY